MKEILVNLTSMLAASLLICHVCVALIPGDTVNSSAIINCLVNYTPVQERRAHAAEPFCEALSSLFATEPRA